MSTVDLYIESVPESLTLLDPPPCAYPTQESPTPVTTPARHTWQFWQVCTPPRHPWQVAAVSVVLVLAAGECVVRSYVITNFSVCRSGVCGTVPGGGVPGTRGVPTAVL